jgi:hypothetical protein
MAENADGTRLPVWWLVEKLRMEVDNVGVLRKSAGCPILVALCATGWGI